MSNQSSQQPPNIQNGNATVRRKASSQQQPQQQQPQPQQPQQTPQQAQPQQTQQQQQPQQQATGGASKTKVGLPSDKTMQQAVKLSIKLVKPICFYFYVDSLKGKVSIMTDGEDKLVFKNEDEHTSPITNTFKCENEYIIVTENTIYIISAETKVC